MPTVKSIELSLTEAEFKALRNGTIKNSVVEKIEAIAKRLNFKHTMSAENLSAFTKMDKDYWRT